MIPLSTAGIARTVTHDIVGRVSVEPMSAPERVDTVRVLSAPCPHEPLDGYAAVLSSALSLETTKTPAVLGCRTDHLQQGDVVSITAQGSVRTVYRRASTSNTLFTTDRCNSLCLMCSQPPRHVDDSERAAELIRIIRLIDRDTRELGITGGEPTLLGQGFLDVVAACRDHLPQTSLHLLSNGRLFYYPAFARALGGVSHPDLMVGVPVYSDIDSLHDFVVQAKGAFDETIIGLRNLAEAGVPVEIRVVLHRHTYERLPRLAEFIYRNLTFASHVALMGLEVIGLAKANVDSLWIDPLSYADQLEESVLMLATCGMNVSIYNHQLCTLRQSLWPYSRQSISDWKNDYAAECEPCIERQRCGGFFTWNLKEHRSHVIRPFVQ